MNSVATAAGAAVATGLLFLGRGIRRILSRGDAGESAVRRLLHGQSGIAAIESLRIVRGTVGRRQILLRIRIADDRSAREVTRSVAQALLRDPSVSDVRMLTSADHRSALEP